MVALPTSSCHSAGQPMVALPTSSGHSAGQPMVALPTSSGHSAGQPVVALPTSSSHSAGQPMVAPPTSSGHSAGQPMVVPPTSSGHSAGQPMVSLVFLQQRLRLHSDTMHMCVLLLSLVSVVYMEVEWLLQEESAVSCWWLSSVMVSSHSVWRGGHFGWTTHLCSQCCRDV